MYRILVIVILALTTLVAADEPVNVNFNLVQVNHYPGQKSLLDSVVTPGKRMVIDMSDTGNAMKYFAETSAIPIRIRNDNKYRTFGGASMGAALAWESAVVLYAKSRKDSFLVASSRTGCPGTEVAPSVSVAFARGSRWSDPPIRFGPLTEQTICPLGNGFQLEVKGRGEHPPLVRVVQERSRYGLR